MTFWPEMRLDGIASDAKIADPTAYGIPPGPAGYSIADLQCVPDVQVQLREQLIRQVLDNRHRLLPWTSPGRLPWERTQFGTPHRARTHRASIKQIYIKLQIAKFS